MIASIFPSYAVYVYVYAYVRLHFDFIHSRPFYRYSVLIKTI